MGESAWGRGIKRSSMSYTCVVGNEYRPLIGLGHLIVVVLMEFGMGGFESLWTRGDILVDNVGYSQRAVLDP